MSSGQHSSSLQSITFSAASVAGGASLTGTVHLSGTSSKAAVVTLALNNTTDPCVIPASVTIPAGSTSANFTIQTETVTKSFTETIWGNYGDTKHAAFTITAGTVQPTASTPTFSPAAGSSTSTQSVTLASATSGATIYYTTDGSTPTTSSTVYSGPISVSATTTVKVIAVASGYTNSTVGSATYTISTVTVTLSSITLNLATVASGGSISGTVHLTGAAPSGGAVVSLSASPSLASGLVASVTVPASATSAPFTIVAPSVTANTTYTITGVYGTTVNVSFVVTAAVVPPPPPPPPPVVTPPVINITAPVAGATVSGTIIASATATDAQGIASVQWQMDGSNGTNLGTDTSSPYTETISTTKFANGVHTLTAIALDTAGLTTTSTGVAITVSNAVVTSGSLAAGLGTPSFADSFNYTSSSEAAFTKVWVPQIYSANNYAGAGSNVTMQASNITFPVDPNLGVPCLCLTLNQSSASASSGGEILSAASLYASTGFGGYGTYEFLVRFGSTSSTPTGTGSAVSGGVSSTFMLSQSNSGNTGYIEIDTPECEGSHPTWAEYDVWFNSDSGGNTEPSGGNFVSQGSGNDSYLVVPTLVTGFNYYGFIWSASRIDYYLNGVLQGSLTQNVPQAQTAAGNIPGLDINHYGCNSTSWGGKATVGTNRYLYVQSAKFWKI